MIRFTRLLNPLTVIIYYAAVILSSALVSSPLAAVVSFACSVAFYFFAVGAKKALGSLKYTVMALVAVTALNPLFNRRGNTVLFRILNIPYTLESAFYGFITVLIIISAVYWISSFGAIMTSEKTMWLLGGIFPKTALVVTCSVAFVPRYVKLYRETDDAQKCLGIYASQGFVDRVAEKLRVFSTVITKCLENSIDSADSMNARGYALKDKTHYGNYRYRLCDFVIAFLSLSLCTAIITLGALGKGAFTYFGTMSAIDFSFGGIAYISAFSLLCLIPLICEITENIKWRILTSKI